MRWRPGSRRLSIIRSGAGYDPPHPGPLGPDSDPLVEAIRLAYLRTPTIPHDDGSAMSSTPTSNEQTVDSAAKAAAKNARQGQPSADVLSWLLQSRSGTLSTLNTHSDTPGFPTGSIVPFALDRAGRPFIFIANIAAHTRNLKQDSRASLFIHHTAAKGDPQSSWRASLIGRFVRLVSSAGADGVQITEAERAELMARYLERVPKARSYQKTHGFDFWRMENIQSIRYIAGFGRICWIPGDRYLALTNPDSHAAMRAGACTHMNEDHAENMKEICRAFHGIDPEQVEMAALDLTGCLFKTNGPDGFVYSSFSKTVEKPADFKTQIIALLHRARQENSAS